MTDRSLEATAGAIRDVHRQLVRELGVMSKCFAGTNYPVTTCHALWEIGKLGPMPVKRLSDLLILDEPSVREAIAVLLDAGEIHETRAEGGPHETTNLALTSQGAHTIALLDRHGQDQATGALTGLDTHDLASVLSGLRLYTTALNAQRNGGLHIPTRSAAPALQVEYHTGWRPGLVGRSVEMHAAYYAATVGFGAFFETRLATGLGELLSRLDRPRNEAWSAAVAGTVVGTVFVDGESLGGDGGGNTAHLRAFIVDGKTRGAGVGRELLARAVAFVDARGFDETHLWTFRGLDAARRLYEAVGFVLAEEFVGAQWGKEMTEQRFVRVRNAGVAGPS